MSSELQERDVKTFYFKQCLKVRVHPSPSNITTERVNLLCISNKYGFIFVGHPTGVKVYKTENLIQKGATIENSNEIVEDLPVWTEIKGVCPSHIAISCDDITLAVCTQKSGLVFGVMYDVRALQDKNQAPAPFLEVALTSSSGVTVQDLAWNPGQEWASILAVCTSDGGLVLLQIQDKLTILARLPPETAATCLCWSPKGKQLVVGKANGTLTQYDQALKEKKTIPCPPPLASTPKRVVDVLWQSTHVFVTAYESPEAGDESDKPQVVISTYPKTGAPSFLLCEDLCFGSGEERKSQYFLYQITDWEFFLGVSSNSVETSVVGKKADDKSSWERWNLEDAGRADMPMNENYDEMYPTGLAVDFTSQTQIQISDTEVQPASPILMLLSTDGLLISFHMINTSPGAPQLVRPPQEANPAEQRKPLAVKQSPQTAPQSPELKNLLTSSGGGSSAARSLFQPVASTAASQAPAQSSLFGSTTKATQETTQSKSSLFGSLGTTGPSFAFAQPAAESKPVATSAGSKPSSTFTFGGKGMFGSLQQTSEGSTGSPSKPAGFSFGVATAASTSGNTPSKSAFSFSGFSSQQQPAQVAPSVSGAQPSGATSSFSFSARPPSGTSTPLASSTPAKKEIIPSEDVKGKPPATSRPLVVPSDDVKGKPPITVKPVAPVAPATSGGTPLFRPTSPTYPPPGLSPKAPVSKVAVQAQPREPVPRVEQEQKPAVKQPSQVKTPGGDPKAENPFTKAILEEKAQFEKEMRDMKAKVLGLNLDVGTKEELIALKRDTETMSNFSTDMADTMKSIQLDVHALKSDVLEAFALMEECKARHDRNQEPKYQNLLRSRSLDPQNQRRMKEIRSHYQWVQSGIREADLKLDTEWEQYLARRNGGKPLRTPATDGIYRTVSNTHNFIVNQNHLIEKLRKELRQTRLHNTTSSWTPSGAATFIDMSSQQNASWSRDILAGQGDISLGALRSPQHSNVISADLIDKAQRSPSKVSSSPISPEKNAKLREILSKRKVTPVRSSRPENLSISQFVSGERMRQMLENAEDDQESFTFRAADPGFRTHQPNVSNLAKSPQKDIKPQSNLSAEAERGLNLMNIHRILQQKSPVPVSQAKSPSTKPPQQQSSAEGIKISLGQAAPSRAKETAQPKLSFAQPSPQKDTEAPKSIGFPIFNLTSKQVTGISVKPVVATGKTEPSAQRTTEIPAKTSDNTVAPSVAKAAIDNSQPKAPSGFTFGQKSENTPAANVFGNTPKSGAQSGFSFQAGQTSSGFNFTQKSGGIFEAASKVSTEAKSSESNKGAGFTSFSFTAKSTTNDATESDREENDTKETSQAAAKPSGLFSFTTSSGGSAGFSFGTPTQAESKKVEEGGTKAGFASGFSFGMAQSKDNKEKSENSSKPGGLSGFIFKPPESPEPTKPVVKEPPKPAKEILVKTSVEVSDAPEGQTTPAAESVAKEKEGSTRKSPAAKSLFKTPEVSSSQNSPSASATEKTESQAAGFVFKLPSSKDEESGKNEAASTSAETTSSSIFGKTSGLFSKPASTSPVFGTTATTSGSIFGTTTTASNTTVTTANSLFGQVATTSGSIFGGTGSSVSIFGGSGTATSSAGSLFGKTSSTTTTASSSASAATTAAVATTAAGLFSSSQSGGFFGGTSTTATTAGSIVGGTSTTTSGSLFGAGSTTTSTAGSGLFGVSTTTTTAGGGLLGASTTSITASGGLFGGTSTTTTAGGGLFGGATIATTASGGLFGGATTATTTGGGLFGGTTTASGGLFGSSAPATTTSGGLFGAAGTTGGGLFGGSTTTTTPSSLLGATASATTTSATSGLFGQGSSAPLFASATTNSGSIFGGAAATSSGLSIFGNAASTSSSSIFGNASSTTPASTGFSFGQAATTSASGFAFGQSSFGQAPAFGQQTSGAPVFGQSAPQDAVAPSGGGGIFGGFGLGGKPSAENANKNVFGSTSFGATTQSSSLFGGVSSTGFGAATSGTGSFGSGPFSGASGGSVAASGFGAIQHAQSPSKPGGFGSTPGFGSPPAFGGTATFGSPPAFGSSVFGGGASFSTPAGGAAASSAGGGIFGSANSGGGFASFAESSAPSFGGLAQSSAPSFGGLAQGGNTAFGGGAFGSAGAPSGSSFQSYR